MNFEDIKNMNKKEFEQFMFNIQSNNKKFCVRCGNFTLDRITVSVAKMETLHENYVICAKNVIQIC